MVKQAALFCGSPRAYKCFFYSQITHWIMAFSLLSKTMALFHASLSNFLGLGRRRISDLCRAAIAKCSWTLLTNKESI